MKLKELFKYRDIELKEKLGTSTAISKGSLIIRNNNNNLNPDIYTLIARNRRYGLCGKDNIIDIQNYKRLNYHQYLELKQSFLQKFYSPKNVEQLSKLLQTKLSQYYPDDRLDITTKNDICNVTIYYPEIIITNDVGTEHKMRDVYILYQFYITNTSLYLNRLEMFRSTYTIGECKNNYVFSHISSSPGCISTDWCFGKTDLNKLYSRFTGNYITYQEILPFIISIEEYLKWESLTGVPYKYIDRIKEFKVKDNGHTIDNRFIKKVYNNLLKNIHNFEYNLELVNGEYIVRIKQNSRSEIDSYLNTLITSKYPDLLQRQIGDVFGSIEEYSDDELTKEQKRVNSNNYNSFIFKDDTLKCTVIKEDINIEQLNNKYPLVIHPDLKSKIYNLLETEFYNYLISYKNNLL